MPLMLEEIKDYSVRASRTNPALYHRSTDAAADAHGSDAEESWGHQDVPVEIQRQVPPTQLAQQTMEHIANPTAMSSRTF